MDERQARLLIRQAFREQDLTVRIMSAADSSLRAVLLRASSLIRRLPPPGDLLREQAWRKLRPQLLAELDGYGRSLGLNLMETLRDEMDRAEEFSQAYLLGDKAKPATTTRSGDLSQLKGVPSFETFVEGADLKVTTGRTYFKALTRARIVDQDFGAMFGVKFDESGEILYVSNTASKVARFHASSVDRLVTRGILEGQSTDDIVRGLISESRRGLNMGPDGARIRSQATTIVRTAIAEALARAHEAFWDDNDDVIEGWVYDAISDSRTCPDCAMYDQREARKRDDLPKIPVHPRCRCQILPLTAAEKLLREQDKREGNVPGGSAVELFTEADMREAGWLRKGETAEEFVKRMRKERQQQIARSKAEGKTQDMRERWYAQPVKKDGKVYFKRARDLPATGNGGILNVPQWLATANKTTQVDFFGGPRRHQDADLSAGERRQALFSSWVSQGMDPREALAKLLSRDSDVVRRHKPYHFIKKALLPNSARG